VAKTLGELGDAVGAKVVGDRHTRICGVASLRNARPGTIVFVGSPRYRSLLGETRAAAVIIRPELLDSAPVAALLSENPQLTFARVARLLHPSPPIEPGIHPTAVLSDGADVHSSAAVGAEVVIEAGAQVGPHVSIGPGCLIAKDCQIGAYALLHGRVTLCAGTVLGQRCILHPGAVIGSDGFGFAKDGSQWAKMPQLGRVRIGDDVEIGANTTVDRGAIDDTVIGDGVKIDNLVQVAHNVRVGEDTAIAGCAGIAGSVTIGARCQLAGGVGVAGHVEIGDDVTVTGMSMVTRSLHEPGVYSSGTAAQPSRDWRRNVARLRHLDELARRVLTLEGEVHQLRAQSGDKGYDDGSDEHT